MYFVGCGGPYVLEVVNSAYFGFVASKLARLGDYSSQIALAHSMVFAVRHSYAVHYRGGDSPHAGKALAACLAFDKPCK
jgi:hypothetical protein